MVPGLFGTRDRFHGRQFFHGPGRQRDGFRITQAHYTYCALYFYYYYIIIYNEIITQLTIMLTGGAQVVRRAMGRGCKYRWSFACLPAAHLLLCSPVPNRPRTSICLGPRGWGPLLYMIYLVPLIFVLFLGDFPV